MTPICPTKLRTLIEVGFCACVVSMAAPEPARAADEHPRPECVGGVCLGDSVTKYEQIIDRVGMSFFGPVGILKDDGEFVSVDTDDIFKSNFVIFNLCHEPGRIRTIRRIVPDEDVYLLLSGYKQKFGTPDVPNWADAESYYLWQWTDPEVTLTLNNKAESSIIAIELHNKEQKSLDDECFELKQIEEKESKGLIPTTRSGDTEQVKKAPAGDTYRPVYYANKYDLTKYIRGPRFPTLEEAREWVGDEQASRGDSDWTYEIGKNCRPSDFGDIEICEETIK